MFYFEVRLMRSGTIHHLSPKLTSHISRVYFQNHINIGAMGLTKLHTLFTFHLSLHALI